VGTGGGYFVPSGGTLVIRVIDDNRGEPWEREAKPTIILCGQKVWNMLREGMPAFGGEMRRGTYVGVLLGSIFSRELFIG